MVRKLFEHIGLIDLNKIVETYGNDEGGLIPSRCFGNRFTCANVLTDIVNARPL